jgi:hypothetical protein
MSSLVKLKSGQRNLICAACNLFKIQSSGHYLIIPIFCGASHVNYLHTLRAFRGEFSQYFTGCLTSVISIFCCTFHRELPRYLVRLTVNYLDILSGVLR